MVDAAREYDLKQCNINNPINTSVEFDCRGFKSNPRKVESAYEDRLNVLVLQTDVVKKAELMIFGEERSTFEQRH